MSFSRNSKLEVLSCELEDDLEAIAFLSGLFHASGEIGKDSEGFNISVQTDIEQLYEYCNKIVKRLYGHQIEISLGESYQISKNTYYEIKFLSKYSKQMLIDTGFLQISSAGVMVNFDIDKNIIIEDSAKRAFIKGVFVAISTSNIKISEEETKTCGSGYHLEFASHNHDFLVDFASMLAEYDILAKIIERKSLYVLYIKEVNAILNLLALVGANNSVLSLSSEIVARQIRNKANREVNCINANLSKTVEASMRQVEAIKTISDIIGLESLSEDLQEVALLRLANQNESLDELLQLSTLKLTKSGLNHRFRKLEKIAKLLME